MKNYFSLISLSLLLLASCSGNTCRITATLPDDKNDGKLVYLQELAIDGEKIINLDSTIIKGNTFKFEVKADSLCVRFLTINEFHGDLTNMVLVFIEKGDVDVNIDTVNVVSGTPMNERYREFLREERHFDMKRTNNYYQVLDEKSKLRFNFVKEIIAEPAGEFFFLTYLSTLEPAQALELIKLSRPQFQNKKEIQQIKMQAEYVMSPEFQRDMADQQHE